MTVGKPDFNLNSFGVKYLSKDEVQEFLEKRQGESIRTVGETKTKPLGRSGRKASKQIIDQKNDHSPASDSKLSPPKPKVVSDSLFGQARERVGEGGGTGSVGRKFTEHTPEKIKPDANTRSVFNSSTYGYGGENKVREQFKQGDEGKGKAPPLNAYSDDGSGQEFKGVGSKGRKWLNENKPEKDEKARGKKESTGISPPKLADAPKDVTGKETTVGQKKIRVGVGEKAHEKLQETGGVGERRYASDRKSPHSLPAENKRKKEAAAARKLGIAQSKVHGLKRRQEIDALGKSSDIIMDMNIMKLNLMNKKDEWDKNERNNENRSRRGRGSPDKSKLPFGTKQQMLHSQAVSGSGKGLKTRENLNPKPIDPKKQTFGEDSEEYGKIYDIQNERTLKSQADETVFKAISLKLDLMKDVKSKRHNYTKLTSAGKNPAKKSPNASEALGAAYASGKMTENSVDADTNTETGATGKPKGSVADQYT